MTRLRTDLVAQISERGYLILFRPGEDNHCPGCGASNWNVGRSMAECAVCDTAIQMVSPQSPTITSIKD